MFANQRGKDKPIDCYLGYYAVIEFQVRSPGAGNYVGHDNPISLDSGQNSFIDVKFKIYIYAMVTEFHRK